MTTDEMLARMASLLQMRGQWHARAEGAFDFHTGATPQEAMQRALGIAVPAVDEPAADLFA